MHGRTIQKASTALWVKKDTLNWLNLNILK